MLPSADILNEFEFGKFVLSNLAAKRAKQLREGAPPLVQIDSNHPLTIALAEIAAGRIKPAVPAAAELIDDGVEVAVLSEDSVPAELGLLLPSLDEVELVPDADEEDADDESDDEVEDRPVSLSDLADDDDDTEEETVAADGDDETLSLSDIAEQESGDDDENESDD
ncbi:MAG: DNA-directed RNA polymerase subunit omega [Fimbriimonadaceae bacterium]|nr:DNA-directed RNA polymerase subunit omega [Fimbriimonadaceae bacterium]